MKKWMALLLVLGMICLCGCGAHINKTEEVVLNKLSEIGFFNRSDTKIKDIRNRLTRSS